MSSTVGFSKARLFRDRAACGPLSLRRNASWIVLGGAVHSASRWGLVVVLARLGNAEMIGQIALAMAVCAPVSFLANLGLRSALVTDAKHEYRFGDYFGLRIVTSLVAIGGIAALVAVAGFEARTALVVLVWAVGKLFESLSDVFHALFQQQERMDRIAVAMMLRGPLVLAFLAVGVALTGNILWGIAGFPLVMAATLFCYDLPTGRRTVNTSPAGCQERPREEATPGDGVRPRWHAPTMIRLARLTWPLGLVAMMISLFPNVPRYVVDYHLGKHALGVFASIAFLAIAGTMVVSALGQSASPRLAKHYAAGNLAGFCRLLGKLLGLVACLGAGLVVLMALFGGPILRLFYGPEFARYADLSVWLMLSATMMFLGAPLGRAVDAMRRFKTHMAIRGVGIVVMAALLPGFVGTYGLKGAAAAMLISAAGLVVVYVSVIGWIVLEAKCRRRLQSAIEC